MLIRLSRFPFGPKFAKETYAPTPHLSFLLGVFSLSCFAQTSTIQSAVVKPGDNLTLENIPPIPASVAEQTARYGESRSAILFSWPPVKHQMFIGTRFGDVQQVHLVKMPGGARQHLTIVPIGAG